MALENLFPRVAIGRGLEFFYRVFESFEDTAAQE